MRAAPAERVAVEDERVVLSRDLPDRWVSGTQLRGLLTSPTEGRGLPAHGAVDPASVVVRLRGRVLEEACDYVLDHEWGSLGLGPDPSFAAEDEVSVDYRYSLRRLDSIVQCADGSETLRAGESHLTVPQPPALDAGESLVANLFVDYHDDAGGERFDAAESASDAPTRTSTGRLPRAVAKLAAGESLRLVCWGDSVTTGAEASEPERAFPTALAAALSTRYPSADVALEVVAAGGSNSGQWLGVVDLPDVFDPAVVCFDRVAEAEPDVVVVEFVNDCGFDMEMLGTVHKEMAARLHETGAEVVLVTPHFTTGLLMGTDDVRTPEVRPQVAALFDLADAEGWAVADASSRWAHLWREGIPYPTLLVNGVNHPDDRGHQLFVDELVKCFQP